MIIVVVKATYFYVIASIIFVLISGTFSLVAGSHQEKDIASANQVAMFPVADLDDSFSQKDSGLPVSLEAEADGLLKPNDTFFDKQWALDQINLSTLWDLTSGSEDILVAILDTGIDSDHEDLQGKVVAEINFTDSPSTNDVNGHGTHVAGIIGAVSNNSLGIAGLVPNCKIMNVKVADDYGFCQKANVAHGIIWSVDHGAKVINISLEIRNPSIALEQAINYAWERGAIIVAAAGNQGNDSAVYPAYYKNCIAVIATRPDDTLAPLSNYGDWVDIAAPGYNIYSTLPGNKYGYETGTSFATAYISGLAAILSGVLNDSNNNGNLNDEVRNLIKDSCRQINYATYSYNIIDIKTYFQQIVMTNPEDVDF